MEKIDIFKERLEKAKIPFKEVFPSIPELSSRIVFEINAGREKYECIALNNQEYLKQVLETEFDDFKFINGYEAIWSKEKNVIEAEIYTADFFGNSILDRLNRLISKPDENEADEEEEDITQINFPNFGDINIAIGHCSREFAFLTSSRERGMRRLNSKRLTLKIINSEKTTHDSAKETLEKIANSIFFQIDLAFEISIILQSQRESFIERRDKRSRKKLFIDKSANISEPKYEYDSEPISLYWYAKESSNMPIFQYLAFYQSIEFYFPIYSSYQAKQKIQSLIKDPRFNPNRDADITKIISTIKSSSGSSFGNEREQLKATISACIENSELRSFIEEDEKRNQYFLENKGKGISIQKISLKNETADLISEVSERIYQIRCRIVHSKASESDFEVLLPYSSEVRTMNYDIELIEFISRKVLITSSRPIKI